LAEHGYELKCITKRFEDTAIPVNLPGDEEEKLL